MVQTGPSGLHTHNPLLPMPPQQNLPLWEKPRQMCKETLAPRPMPCHPFLPGGIQLSSQLAYNQGCQRSKRDIFTSC